MAFGVESPRQRENKRWPKVVIGIAIAVVALVVAFFIADAVLRSVAEKKVSSEITSNLPSSVTGDVAVKIAGPSVIAQYLGGTFQQVSLNAPKLKVQGNPIDVEVVATGVPTDLSKPVGNVHGTLSADAATVNSFIKVPGSTSDLTLGNGTVSYHGKATLFGISIGYEVAVKPVPRAGSILLEPTHAKLTTGGFGFDVSKPLTQLLAANPPSVCVAQYLPKGVNITGITITSGTATVELDAPSLVLTQQALATKGSC